MTRSHVPSDVRARAAVITVSYGSGEALEVFLSSLREHHGDEIPVVVVDNKPDHESVEALASRFGALYLPLPDNPGYGAGMNRGVSAIEAMRSSADRPFDAYFFCNPDLRFVEPAVEPLLDSLSGDVDAGSIGPRLLNEDGTTYPSARDIPSLGTGIGHALFGRVWKGNPWTRRYQKASDYERRRSAGSLSGAAVMVKQSVYERIGGWDEAYFMHFEDIDLGYRIGLAGFTNVYDPVVSVEHVGAHSTKNHAVVVERAMTESAVRFMGKRYAGFRNAPLRWAITLGLRLRGGLKVAAARRGERMERAS
ncbi:glycosyltransferase [Leucobacter ruminantium]|uniref:Glycosyltransferase family 2 protein n=1 Tax=Leucobacter ruminantium TaxID=1289170 RepID=A0A939M1Z2_9MICO|nr:glycosyltransferase family 2 protein [Leucobacter ruminantium]MBO1805560.1 glycosyltransferase family 2 protein [Leucobacter ruminantium]